MPMWGYMLQFRSAHGVLPTLAQTPRNFTLERVNNLSQSEIPPLTLAGSFRWSKVRTDALESMPTYRTLYSPNHIITSKLGFIPDLSKALGHARLLLAPNLINGSGVSTKVRAT